MAKLKREKVLNEDGIYYGSIPNHYDILVSMRIGDRQLQRKKKKVKNLTAARKFRDDFLADLEKLKSATNGGDIYWSQALQQYFKKLEALMKANEMSLATYQTRSTTLTAHTATWNNMKLSEIHQEWIRIFFADNFQTQTLETKKNVLKFIRQVFEHQIRIGNKTLRFNPTNDIKFKKQIHKKPETFSKAEIEKIIHHAHAIQSDWAPIYYVAYQIGARSGELFALKWSDVDWNNKTITIRKSYCWKSKEEKEPKNSKERTLPLNEPTLKYLSDLKTRSNSIYILPHLSAWKKGRAAQILNSVKQTLGITGKTNFHSIRSTFITQLLIDDVPPIKVMEMAGHQDFKTTMIYVRSIAKELKGATDKLGLEINLDNVLPLKKNA